MSTFRSPQFRSDLEKKGRVQKSEVDLGDAVYWNVIYQAVEAAHV